MFLGRHIRSEENHNGTTKQHKATAKHLRSDTCGPQRASKIPSRIYGGVRRIEEKTQDHFPSNRAAQGEYCDERKAAYQRRERYKEDSKGKG